MASQSLISTVNGYENYIKDKGKDEQVINAYVDACSVAINGEKDIEYGVMVSLLKRYSVTGKKQLDDVPDVFSNFALRMTQGSRIAKVEAVHNPFRGGLY